MLNKFYLLVLCIFIFSSLRAQIDTCGVIDTSQQDLMELFDSIGYPAQTTASSITYEIPIHLYVINDDSGVAPAEYAVLRFSEALEFANEVFTNGMHFYVSSLSQIDDTSLQSTGNISILNSEAEDSEAISVYFTKNSPGISGRATLPNDPTRRGIIVDASMNLTTLAHELGHFFGLRHTFMNTVIRSGGNFIDLRILPDNSCNPDIDAGIYCFDCGGDGCDGYETGDGISDTPVDPYYSFECFEDECDDPVSDCVIFSDAGMVNYTYSPDRSNIGCSV